MPNVCKFRNAKCFKCGKIGHVQKACLKNVGKSGNLYWANSNPTLCCLRREEISNPYYITAHLDNHDVHMLIDSGSENSLLNKETFLEYWKLTQLKRSEILLNTWSSSQVKILGKLYVKARLSHGSRSLQILVADGLGPNILGRQWFSAFRLKLNFLNSLETNPISPDFEELFKEEIDAYNGPLIHIDIPDNAEPKFVKARTVPFALRNLVDEKLKALEEQGIIELKFSKWASPIVTVLKNDGTIRICHDYKTTVNLYTNPDKYPLPTIPQLLDRLRVGKVRVFTKLDMAQAYQQLKVDDESSEILTINTPRGLYRVKRLPFELNSAVGTFQRFMDTLLMGIDGVAVYLDDVLISGINCGMKIDNKGIHPSEEKLRAIKDARPPSNKKELMSFLGLLNYYERFLRNKATVVEPLHRLLDSNNPWKWNREHQRAFKEAKSLISSESVLAHFDDNLPILVSCDASEYGIGAILSQVDHEVERPVVFASRTLNKTERRYAVIDKEALAVIFGVSKFSQYLLGRKFKILTDHKPLVGMFNPKKPIPQVLSPRMLRWCLTLAAYTYTMEYKPGKVNCNADALSRLPLNECPSVVPNVREVFFIESEYAAINSSEVAKITSKDPILSKVKFWAMNRWPERKVDDRFKDFVSKSNEISVHKDCLLWGSRVIIPERLRKYILNLLHDTHIGIVGTKALARGLCWWPKMDGDIERMICSCAVCLSCSHDPPKTDVYPWIWPSRPWSRLHIDHAGPFQGKLFLVVIDAYSKWIEAKIVSTTSTETTINSLKEIFATHGLPDVIVSDNGTSFTSELFRTFLKRNGVRHILCAPYHAASNGQVERAIQTLKNLLRKNSSGNWTTRLSRSLLSMRIAINSTTQKSPAQLLMNRNLKSLINKFHPEGVSEGRMRQEDRLIRNWKPHRVVNEGQAVIARGYHGPRWLPGVVREKTGPVSIKVETNDGEIVNRHLDQVRSCEESEALPSTSSTPQVTPDFERPPAVQETDSSEGTPKPVLRRSLRIRKPPSFFEGVAIASAQKFICNFESISKVLAVSIIVLFTLSATPLLCGEYVLRSEMPPKKRKPIEKVLPEVSKKRNVRSAETAVQREHRLRINRERASTSRAAESVGQRENRLQQDRDRASTSRAAESLEQRPNILGRQWFSAFRLKLNFLNSLETNPISPDFEELFKEEIDAYNGPLIHIDIPDNAEPKFVKARTVPFALRNLVDEKLKALEEQGIIELKFSKWASPIVTVLKNDGTIRICHDYKTTVNLYTNPDKYPLPTIPQLLDRLRVGKVRVFTKLDMAQAYQQLKVDDESSEILTINTPRGLYRVKRLPFELNSAVGTFQRFMDTLLMGIDGVAVYLDDVLISGINCGMKIDNKGIHPSEEKLRAIKDARPPSNKKELMSFLGLLNYYERFLRNKATVVEPLHRLLDSNNPWKWNREHQRAFKEAKSLISSESVLAHFDDNLPILVSCDASEYGIGAILSQVDHEVERPVVFASRTLNKTERRYAVIDKEALAVIFGVSKFSQYLLGRKFKILTDHKPLVGMFNPKKPIPQVLSPRMLRWCLTLAAYTYTMEYKPGKVNCNADALSRLPLNECPSVVPNVREVFFIESEYAAINSSEVAKITSKDPILSKVKFWAMNRWPERKVDDRFKDFVSKSNEISVHKDCLLWGSRVIIPERLRKYILNLLHDTHIGIVGTKALARGLCWWPKMDGDIERMICSCAVCLSCSHDPPKTDVYPWIWPSRPWSRLHIDHAGPFQGKLFLVVIDAYSKWIEAKIVSTTSTETTINSLKEIFATHGLPDVIVSDNGTSFTSELFRTFLKRNGVRHILCAPYHAASNGQVERAIQTLKNLLRKNSSGNWTTRLSRSLLSMRIAINSTTQKSPAQLLMNRNLKSLINKFHPEGVSEGRMRQEDRLIRNWKPHRVVNEGQAVIARGYHGPRWLPGVVREKTGPVSIKVETNDGEIVNRHLDQVRSCEESEALPSTSSTPQVTPDFERPPAVQETDSSEGTPKPVLRRSLRIRKPPSFFE
ncbi:hypothetical protein LAZ67_11001093, partial [Cordylochernes scorpioides]